MTSYQKLKLKIKRLEDEKALLTKSIVDYIRDPETNESKSFATDIKFKYTLCMKFPKYYFLSLLDKTKL